MYLPFPEFFKYTGRPMVFSSEDDITKPAGTGYYNQDALSANIDDAARKLNNCMLPSENPVSKESEKDLSLFWMLTILPYHQYFRNCTSVYLYSKSVIQAMEPNK